MENNIICNQTLCLFREMLYCMHDEHMICPNNNKCAFFTKAELLGKNKRQNEP